MEPEEELLREWMRRKSIDPWFLQIARRTLMDSVYIEDDPKRVKARNLNAGFFYNDVTRLRALEAIEKSLGSTYSESDFEKLRKRVKKAWKRLGFWRE